MPAALRATHGVAAGQRFQSDFEFAPLFSVIYPHEEPAVAL